MLRFGNLLRLTEFTGTVLVMVTVIIRKGYRLKINPGKKHIEQSPGEVPSQELPRSSPCGVRMCYFPITNV